MATGSGAATMKDQTLSEIAEESRARAMNVLDIARRLETRLTGLDEPKVEVEIEQSPSANLLGALTDTRQRLRQIEETLDRLSSAL